MKDAQAFRSMENTQAVRSMEHAHEVHSMDNEGLHLSAVRLAREERVITQRLLLYLREIERRRMYLDYECGSLYEYCIRALKYSEGSATRRVNASRLLASVPEISDQV